MRKITIEILASLALTAAAVVASAHAVWAGDVMVTSAFARASATPQAMAGAIYVTISNHGAADDKLVGIVTQAAATAEVHESKSENGMMRMDPVPVLDIPAGGSVAMKPGGLHIMLMRLNGPLQQGGSVHVDFTFEKAGKVSVDVPVKGVAASAP